MVSEIINVDFKNKCVKQKHTEYQWCDAITGNLITYDPRRNDNIPHVKMSIVGFQVDGKASVVDVTFKVDDIHRMSRELKD